MAGCRPLLKSRACMAQRASSSESGTSPRRNRRTAIASPKASANRAVSRLWRRAVSVIEFILTPILDFRFLNANHLGYYYHSWHLRYDVNHDLALVVDLGQIFGELIFVYRIGLTFHGANINIANPILFYDCLRLFPVVSAIQHLDIRLAGAYFVITAAPLALVARPTQHGWLARIHGDTSKLTVLAADCFGHCPRCCLLEELDSLVIVWSIPN